METIIKLFLLIVILHIFFAGCSDISKSSEDELDTAIVTADNTDTTAPIIAKETNLIISCEQLPLILHSQTPS